MVELYRKELLLLMKVLEKFPFQDLNQIKE
jgi:hypothetical protein